MSVTYTITAGVSGTVTGFVFGAIGTISPTHTVNGDQINALIIQNEGLPVIALQIAGEHAKGDLPNLTLNDSELGEIELNPANTIFYYDAGLDQTTWAWQIDPAAFINGGVYTVTSTPGVNYNCNCEDSTGYETLAQLRARLMIRLGYAGQVNNPPPGMSDLLNDFLKSSQRVLYSRYKELHTERYFKWTMEPGIKFYDLPDNDDPCPKELNALRITSAHIEDLNGAWYPLIDGIPGTLYTASVPLTNSLPYRYEIRQCIEVYPPPNDAYVLHIKGQFKLMPLDEDTDVTTIDSELVFLWALATAKAHYGHPDANNYAAMANDYLGRLVSGAHGTKRFIPRGGAAAMAPVVRPVMRDGYNA